MYKEITVICDGTEYLAEIDDSCEPQDLVEYIKRELGISGKYCLQWKSGNIHTDNMVVELLDYSNFSESKNDTLREMLEKAKNKCGSNFTSCKV